MIKSNVQKILQELPPGIKLVAAAKTRTIDEILEAISAGVEIIGENYVQEAKEAYAKIGNKVRWHFIGHLQKNKAKKAVKVFDVIETVDSFSLAQEIDKRAKEINKTMEVLIEVNSAEEEQKSGVLPQQTRALAEEISKLENIKIKGLMTMGPLADDPEKLRPFFKKTKILFEELKILNLPRVSMQYLSMGMSDSYKVAIEEGANLVRIGTKLFGPRSYSQ